MTIFRARHGLLAGLFGVMAIGAAAQPPRPAATESVEVDPITCWWRTSTSAVRTGEPFSLALTCMVVDTEATKIVPDLSRLDPSVVQLPPFEVLGGSHAGDLRTPGKRFLQYEYRLRVIAEETFGADIVLPPLAITYIVESTVSSGDTVQGRDLTYELPKASVRVISLVPDDTMDIREMPAAAFSDIETRLSRGNTYQTVATVLFGLAGLMAVMVLISLFRRRGPKTEAERLHLSNRTILRSVNRELAEIKRQSQGGWTEELVGRALAAARVAGSYATGAPVGQRRGSAASAAEGHLLVGSGFGRAGAMVSGAATANTVATSGVAAPGLEDSLRTLTAIHYGRGAATRDAAGDALDAAIRVAQAQASAHSIVAEWMARVRQSFTDARKRVWA